MDNKILGKRIIKLLDRYELNQRQLSKLVGVSEVSMSRYIKGQRTPNSIILSKIATALNTSSDYLLGIDNNKNIEIRFNKIKDLITENLYDLSNDQKLQLINILSKKG